MNLEIKPYKEKYAKELQKIICKTWKYEEYFDHKLAINTSKVYLASCLIEQTFARVAILDGKVVGLIMVKDNKTYKRKFKYVFNLLIKSVPFWFNKNNLSQNLYNKIDEIDEKLLKNTSKNYDAEIAFFFLSEECRGLGIGKKLFNIAMSYLEKQEDENFYLFTDETCNYGFYEHCGLKRCGQDSMQFPNNMNVGFFIYDGKTKEIKGNLNK